MQVSQVSPRCEHQIFIGVSWFERHRLAPLGEELLELRFQFGMADCVAQTHLVQRTEVL